MILNQTLKQLFAGGLFFIKNIQKILAKVVEKNLWKSSVFK